MGLADDCRSQSSHRAIAGGEFSDLPFSLYWGGLTEREMILSTLDRTYEFKRAFELAEAAWMRWRKSPPGDAAHERHGEALSQAFLDAAAAYQDYARQETAVRRDNTARNALNTGRAFKAATDDYDLDLPDFLRRKEHN
jgi:hypothetical protein